MRQTEEAYRKNTLYYDNALNSLTILNALNSVNANQSGQINLANANGVSHIIKPNSASTSGSSYELPLLYNASHSGILAVQNDITDQLLGAGIEIDFANRSYRKIGRTDYDNMACFGNRKLCILNRDTSGDSVSILTDFSTNPYLQNIMVQ